MSPTTTTPSRIELSANAASRDSRLDAIRGLCLLIMMVDHLPTILKNVTFEFAGYVSAAEGFVFLSGFVAGLVYTQTFFKKAREMVQRARRRAMIIYLFHLATFLILFLYVRIWSLEDDYWKSWRPLLEEDVFLAILAGATFICQPRFLDVLPMYCIFLIATPRVVKEFAAGNGLAVLGTSAFLWALAQFGIPAAQGSFVAKYVPANLGGFNIFAWQTLFVLGLYLGFKRNRQPHGSFVLSTPFLVYCTLLGLVLFLCRRGVLVDFMTVLDPLTDKRNLGIVRLLNFGVILMLIAHIYPQIKMRFGMAALAYLGRHSLPVFTAHIALVYVVNTLFSEGAIPGNVSGMAITLVCVGSLYLVAWICESRRLL